MGLQEQFSGLSSLNCKSFVSGGFGMNIRRMTVILLSCLLLAGMALGCGREEESGNIITYIPTYYPLDETIQDVGTACSGNGMMYFIG